MYDYIVQFIKSREFNGPINDYVDNNCSTFDDKDENKLEHTNIHNKYKELVENILTKMLSDIGCSPEQFVKCAELGLKIPEDKSYFEQIIAVDNFLYFKAKFVKRNYELKESSYKLMYAAENKNTQNELTYDENYNTLLKIKERNEYECAIAMSLAMIEEKEKLGFDYDKDQEFIVSLRLFCSGH